MLAPNSSASGPSVAKRGGGSSPATGVSRAVVAGDAQATTYTSSTGAHTRGRARLFASARPPAPSLVCDLRAHGVCSDFSGSVMDLPLGIVGPRKYRVPQ